MNGLITDTTLPFLIRELIRKLFFFLSCGINNFNRSFDFRTLFKPIRAFLGGRIRFVLSGGAPLAPETHKFMKTTLCCPVLQGYGLTETCAATTLMDFDDNSWGIY
jgi:long-subunit acyl-CoA synthetase (AMP-forming)